LREAILVIDGSTLEIVEANDAALRALGCERDALLTLVGHDISHRKEAAEQARQNRRRLAKLAEQDALTGLPNRHYLHNRLPQVLAKVAAGSADCNRRRDIVCNGQSGRRGISD
jgi:PAS domain-containing protein